MSRSLRIGNRRSPARTMRWRYLAAVLTVLAMVAVVALVTVLPITD